jgi:hypothetical protein
MNRVHACTRLVANTSSGIHRRGPCSCRLAEEQSLEHVVVLLPVPAESGRQVDGERSAASSQHTAPERCTFAVGLQRFTADGSSQPVEQRNDKANKIDRQTVIQSVCQLTYSQPGWRSHSRSQQSVKQSFIEWIGQLLRKLFSHTFSHSHSVGKAASHYSVNVTVTPETLR